MVTCYIICHDKNDDYYHKRRMGGGQRVMIEIIILVKMMIMRDGPLGAKGCSQPAETKNC